jgi:transcriptional regulator with XRE-family HTH domain
MKTFISSEKIDSCANRIRKALALRHMKQYELCKRANIPKSSLSLYLQGAYLPKQDRIYDLAMVLNVSEAWLMGYDVPMEKKSEVSPTRQELSEGEQMLLDLFNRVPEDQQKLVLQMIRAALDNL